jgi:phytol kinase
MITPHDLRGALIISALFFGLLIVAELWMRLGTPKPEWTRKLVHLGGGMIGIFLPWLIESPLVVLVLTVSLSSIFLLGDKTKLLKSLHGVERKSRGSEYYPLAIWLVFVIAADRPWLYLSAVLVLALADAFAALIGSRYGAVRYEVEDSYKSLEGSVVFFFIAFMALHLPMLLMTNLPRATCVLAALLVAMLVTIFEAISLEGTDNIFIPIAVVFVLQKITTKPVAEIAYQNLSLVAIVVGIALLDWKFRWFNVGGALTVMLFIFATWSLGSRRWSAPVFIALAALVTIRTLLASRVEAPLKVRTISRALMVPFLFLLTANMTGRYDFFYGPYVAACAAVLAFILWTGGVRLRLFGGWNRVLVAVAMGVASAAIVALPMWAIYRATPWAAVAALMVLIAAMSLVNVALTGRRIAAGWTATPFLLAALTGALLLVLQQAHLIASWRS